ncbi:MAG: leucine-rich repeat domain-containing protein, partial [Candidatus Promineifilaceae bacterium]
MLSYVRLILLFTLSLHTFWSLANTPKVSAQPPFDCTAVSGIPETECDALVALYNDTDGDNWTDNTNWLQTNTPCSWYGITCTNNQISQIALSSNNLQGDISSDFTNLPSLTELFLYRNQLTTVPDFSGLPSLTRLSLNENKLTTVPDFSGFSSLTWLDLDGNQLTTVPDFSNLPSLEHLHLDGNQLTTVPDFSNLPSLIGLMVGGNQFTTMPDFSNLPSLRGLFLFGSRITTVPDFSGLPRLVELYLNSNQITTVPDFSGISSLKTLFLSNNKQLTTVPNFSGLPSLRYFGLNGSPLTTVPDFSGLSNLRRLFLGSNPQLAGVIPFTYTTLDLEEFSFNHTQLCEPQDAAFQTWLAGIDTMRSNGISCTQASFDCTTVSEIPETECNALVALYNDTHGDSWTHNTNWLQTNTPCSWYGIICTNNQISQIALSSNNLQGGISSGFANFSSLTRLTLHENVLTTVPDFSSFPSLIMLTLQDNQLTTAPDFNGLSSLAGLSLDSNQQLVGAIPFAYTALDLEWFHFDGTQLCEPQDAAFQTWLAGIGVVRSTGVSCIQPSFDCTIVSEIPETECDALVAFYNDTDGDNWTYNTNWLQTNTPCSWYGIICSNNQIQHIRIRGNNLQGDISSDFANLSSLIWLELDNNQLTTVPDFNGFSSLTELYLYNNQLTTVPDFSDLSSLEFLYLYNNQLTTVPDFSGLSSLTRLDLGINQLTTVPDFSNLPSLTELNLDNNELTIASDFSSLSSLIKLYLNNNELTTVPDFIGLSGLERLTLSHNPQLIGAVPLTYTALDLEVFSFSGTQLCEPQDIAFQTWLEGIQYLSRTSISCAELPFDCTVVSEIPETECDALVALYNDTDGDNWTNSTDWLQTNTPCSWYGITCTNNRIYEITLASNNLQGGVSSGFANLSSLQILNLGSNQLTTVPDFSGFSSLKNLRLSENKLTTVPNFSSPSSLQVIHLYDNQLTTVPDFSGLSSLTSLSLSHNQLTTVPDLSGLSSLQVLNLRNNPQLAGAIPSAYTVFDLNLFYFDDTQLCEPQDVAFQTWLAGINSVNSTGVPCTQPSFDCTTVSEIPETECDALVALYNDTDGANWIGNTNWLQTNTPCSWYGITCTNNQIQRIRLRANNLQGAISSDFTNLSSLTALDLSKNQLTTVPDFSGFSSLTELFLYTNQLTTVPDFSNLPSLTLLHLFDNQLTLVPDFSDLPSLTLLNLGTNQLTTVLDFSNFPSLTELNLSENQLTTVPNFSGLSSLTILYLHRNELTTVPDFSGLPSLKRLTLSNNPQLIGAIPHTYTAFDLEKLTTNDTQLCEPQDVAFQTWLGSIQDMQGNDIPCNDGVLGVYFLAFDNDTDSPANLTARYAETLRGITAATVGTTNTKAVVLVDLSGDGNNGNTGNTGILTVEDGVATMVSGLPDANGTLDPNLTEYDMGDGQQLGQFLKWALDNHGAAKTIVSYVGHGHYSAPDVDWGALSSSTRSNTSSLFPLPYYLGGHPDFTDSTPNPSLITPYALQQMLEIGTQGGLNPVDVLDLVHCFSATIEELYEVANDGGTPYATIITASPSYTFFAGEMLGNALMSIDVNDTAQDLSETMLTAYDATIIEHDLNDELGNSSVVPDDINHPRQLIAVESAALPAIKTAMDELSAELLREFNTDPTTAYNKLAAAYAATTQFYDTTFCNPQDWEMAIGDALVDIVPFMEQVETVFGSTVATKAEAVRSATNAAILHSVVQNGTPWIAAPLTPMWEFNGSGLALYADLHGTDNGIGREHTLSWVSRFYTDTTSIGSPNDNPHPFRFIQGSNTWADVFIAFWAASGLTTTTNACLPTVLPVSEIIELDAVGGPNNIDIDWQIVHPLTGGVEIYNVYMAESSVTTFELETTQISANYIDVGPFDVGGQYCYYVEAVDKDGVIIGTSNTSCAVFGELSLVIQDHNVAPNTTRIPVPISAINADGLCIPAMDIKIKYDSSKVVAVGVENTAFLADYRFTANTSVPGVVNIASFARSCQTLSGSGALVYVLFDVIGTVGDVSTLDFVHGIASTAIYNQVDPSDPTSAELVPTHLLNGSVTIATAFTRGDVNGDGVVNAFDAFLAFHITLETI